MQGSASSLTWEGGEGAGQPARVVQGIQEFSVGLSGAEREHVLVLQRPIQETVLVLLTWEREGGARLSDAGKVVGFRV